MSRKRKKNNYKANQQSNNLWTVSYLFYNAAHYQHERGFCSKQDAICWAKLNGVMDKAEEIHFNKNI